MLMFQQTSARDRAGSSSTSARSIWLMGGGAAARPVRAGQVVAVDAARVAPFR